MKKFLEKTCNVLGVIYGYGILITLFAGGLTFFGYVVALCVGGDVAAKICEILYKHVFKYIIIASSCVVILGIIKMYLSGEVALSIEKKKKESKAKKQKKADKKAVAEQVAEKEVEQPTSNELQTEKKD